MLRNNNRDAVKKLSGRTLRANRVRNAFAVLAIFLTTFLISSAFGIGISFAENMTVMLCRLSGTAADTFLSHPTRDDITFVQALPGVKSTGTQITAGSARGETEDGKRLRIAMLVMDKDEWERHYIPAVGEVTGAYPQAENEIMLSEKAARQLFERMPQIGEEVSLAVKGANGDETTVFTVSGFFTEFESTQDTGIALLSERYAQSRALTVEENGRLCIATKKMQRESIYSALVDRMGDERFDDISAGFDVKSESTMTTVTVAAILVLLALFVVASGYLLIYNIFYISVTRDIRFYGMLKTIGASPKQLRKIVFRHGLLLSVPGILLGLLASAGMAFLLVPFALRGISDRGASAMPAEISFSPLIYLCTAFFSLLTVYLSCRKPAKMAGSVSPIEAARYTGVTRTSEQKRKTAKHSRLVRLARHNVFRERKRAIVVFASLFMGIVTFLCVGGFFSSMDVKNYIAAYHPHDFVWESVPPLGEEKFDDAFLEEVASLDGVTDMTLIRSVYARFPFDKELFRPVLEDTVASRDDVGTADELAVAMENYDKLVGFGAWVVAIPDALAQTVEGLDMDAFRRGEVCIIGYGRYEEMTGRTLELTNEKQGNRASITVGGCFQTSEQCPFARFAYAVGSVEGIFVSEAFLNRFDTAPPVSYITLDVKPNREPAIRARLTQLNAMLTNTAFLYTARSEAAEAFSSSMRTMNVLTGGVSALLIFIGVLNFVNVSVTGIFTRRQELAVLQSVGMTKKQISKMLVLEGGWYAAITSFLILTLGSGALLVLARAVPFVADFARVTYPATEIVCLIAAIFAICLCVPPLVFRLTCKESVTERLRVNT